MRRSNPPHQLLCEMNCSGVECAGTLPVTSVTTPAIWLLARTEILDGKLNRCNKAVIVALFGLEGHQYLFISNSYKSAIANNATITALLQWFNLPSRISVLASNQIAGVVTRVTGKVLAHSTPEQSISQRRGWGGFDFLT